ncbi:ferritin-like domain-containing protein [Actinokineospora sp. NBRC 105648]|uniref:ferritin-like domain-containing protein n=1 Tax=Actinokineospora sp. NBRC 105648 TaxID=3032206 RepID=UPI0024A33FA9|nr:ferritin-like domain-containing protein [Actinokineospora sp. NBRC 105648]GLZ38664.1 membrane protein [Actinokineospora sp. NBRC 105648]
MTFDEWLREFTEEAARRSTRPDPEWTSGTALHPELVRSVQRFQVGENGDGANLIAKAGDGAYGQAARLFVAEEQNHARLLAGVLAANGASTIASCWTDVVFVWLRRALGLRLELMVLTVAEAVALTYYRVLRDGVTDRLTAEVAGRLLADERRHVRFHRDSLSAYGRLPFPILLLWRVLFLGAVVVVALDHRRALRVLGVSGRAFVRESLTHFAVVSNPTRSGDTVHSVGAR